MCAWARRYELYLYTMGNQQYAMEMQRIIDTDKSKFGDRVISNELIQRQVKGLDVVLGAEHQVLIVDDSEYVRLTTAYLSIHL